jgi:hypothetical protein
MTSVPHNATDNTAPQTSPSVHRGLLLLGILCALFLAATPFLQHSRFAPAAAARDALQVPPTSDSSATAGESDWNLAILKIAH